MACIINENECFENRLEIVLQELESSTNNKIVLDFPEIILDNSTKYTIFKNFKQFLKIIKSRKVLKKDSEYFENLILKLLGQELSTTVNWMKQKSDGITIKNKKGKNEINNVIKKIISTTFRCKSCSSLNVKFKRIDSSRGLIDKIICRDCGSTN